MMYKGMWEGFIASRRADSNHRDGTLLFAWIKKVWHAILNGYGVNNTNFGYKMSCRLVEKQELMSAKLWFSVGLKFGKRVSGNSVSEVINQVKRELIHDRKVLLLNLNGVEVVLGMYLDTINRIYVFYSPLSRQVVQSSFVAFEQEILKSIGDEHIDDSVDETDEWSAVEIVYLK